MFSLSVILAAIDNEEDREIIAAFYEKYFNYSLNLAFSILKDRHYSEDAVQDAFKYIAEHPWRIVKYEEKSAKWFLSELIRDFANNIIRKESKHFPIENLDAKMSEDYFLEEMEKAQMEDIKAAVSELNPTDQAIIRLFTPIILKQKRLPGF